MKKLVLLFVVLALCAPLFGQAKSTQEVLNYNMNAARYYSDTLRVTAKIDTVVLVGKAYNVWILPTDGAVYFRLSNDSRYWPHWMTIPQNKEYKLEGCDVDSLFFYSSGTINVNLIYTSF